MSHAADTFLL